MTKSDARHYLEYETLGNGLEICIRAARPDDSERALAAFHELDPESVYLRFFGYKKELSAAEIRNFREADFTTRVILLGTIMRKNQEVVIASATYVLIDAAAAEVAFIVEEDYHKLGIARRMLQHLGRIASAAGIKTFSADVLPYNTAMLRVFERCGWPMTTQAADGCLHITLTLNT